MPTLWLSFSGNASMAVLRQVAGSMVSAFTGRERPWVEGERVAVPDRNRGPARTGSVQWLQPGAVLTERVANGTGDPRDGYGYRVQWTLTTQAGTASLHDARGADAHGPLVWQVDCGLDVFERVRVQVGRVLGVDRDHTDLGWHAVENVRAAARVDAARALRWLDQALALGPHAEPHAWPDLLDLSQALHGDPARTLALRLRTAPQQVAAWERAAGGGPGFSAVHVASVLRRLRPVPPSQGPEDWPHAVPADWLRLDDGLGPRAGSRWPALVPGLLRALFPGVMAQPSECVDRVQVRAQGRITVSHVRAVWGQDPELPRALVQRSSQWLGPPQAPSRSTRRVRRTRVHTWGFGAPGDCVQVVTLTRKQGGRLVHVGVCVGMSGSDGFRAATQDALAQGTPFGWVAADAWDLFPERALRTCPLPVDVGPKQQSLWLLDHIGGFLERVFAAVRACACHDWTCAHQAVLAQAEEVGTSHPDDPPAQVHLARARACALGFTRESLRGGAVSTRNAKDALDQLARSQAIQRAVDGR
jgi:hypothetical protein